MKYCWALAICIVNFLFLIVPALASEASTSKLLESAMDGEDTDVEKAVTSWLVENKSSWPDAHSALVGAGFRFEEAQAPCRNYTFKSANVRGQNSRSIAVIWCRPAENPMVLVMKWLPEPGPQFEQPQIIPSVK